MARDVADTNGKVCPLKHYDLLPAGQIGRDTGPTFPRHWNILAGTIDTGRLLRQVDSRCPGNMAIGSVR